MSHTMYIDCCRDMTAQVIADQIREKTGKTASIKGIDFPDAIGKISPLGVSDGMGDLRIMTGRFKVTTNTLLADQRIKHGMSCKESVIWVWTDATIPSSATNFVQSETCVFRNSGGLSAAAFIRYIQNGSAVDVTGTMGIDGNYQSVIFKNANTYYYPNVEYKWIAIGLNERAVHK